jgi:hypothetical protein
MSPDIINRVIDILRELLTHRFRQFVNLHDCPCDIPGWTFEYPDAPVEIIGDSE